MLDLTTLLRKGEPACAIYKPKTGALLHLRLWNGQRWEQAIIVVTSLAAGRRLVPRGWRLLIFRSARLADDAALASLQSSGP